MSSEGGPAGLAYRGDPRQPGISSISRYLPRITIAHLSMEIAVRPEMHTHAGALGVLAGDTAGSCADLSRPVVFVSLISRAGYLRQELDAEEYQINRPRPVGTAGLDGTA